MWKELPAEKRNEYRRLILAFAGLTEMFAQKADENSIPAPVINSKFQETVFQKALGATAEDIGNTSYDAALIISDETGIENKYLVGIKTFGIGTGDQKVAQFKKNQNDWFDLALQAEKNAKNASGEYKEKEEIDACNHDIYLKIALKIAELRNMRIDSSIAKIRGFQVNAMDNNVHSIYHVLMPSSKNQKPQIFVGETTYDKIDISNLCIEGCTKKNNPKNFKFSDGKHTYSYSNPDSQLSMNFSNKDIVVDTWDVIYADDAYKIFSHIADEILGEDEVSKRTAEKSNVAYFPAKPKITEEYIWPIFNDKGEVEKFSGFNAFYGVGSKLGKDTRKQRIEKISEKYLGIIENNILNQVISGLKQFLLDSGGTAEIKEWKVELRKNILNLLQLSNNAEFEADVVKLIFRPVDEMYIPVPKAKQFHSEHPDFFGKGVGTLKPGTHKLKLAKEQRKFNLIFEPSGDVLEAYITQDDGKAIESFKKQTDLGEWILRGIFQLDKYEPLTRKRLDEMGINALRLFKVNDSDDVHLEFVWKDYDKSDLVDQSINIEWSDDLSKVAYHSPEYIVRKRTD